MELCSLWDENLRDHGWNHIKVFMVNDKFMNAMDNEYEKLKDLKKNYGEEVYKASTTTLIDINDYNPKGRYIMSELWNYIVKKKDILEEGVTVLLNLWKKMRLLNNFLMDCSKFMMTFLIYYGFYRSTTGWELMSRFLPLLIG
ncbi:hypothetical protein FXO38_22923 [Capsicum annuum]|uniref:Factor of DNA methylation 1-5/IDN2 domain-containing protein n=1 Tax=Capsicum annuum TaxID=4072 RepID=A0A2G2ZJ51_CAPAN|nr:hypothetical protein FXO38_22923 [Capsicum annuum]PHT81955.1 hypothetical protein T459_14970 [Capsicum annuum]